MIMPAPMRLPACSARRVAGTGTTVTRAGGATWTSVSLAKSSPPGRSLGSRVGSELGCMAAMLQHAGTIGGASIGPSAMTTVERPQRLHVERGRERRPADLGRDEAERAPHDLAARAGGVAALEPGGAQDAEQGVRRAQQRRRVVAVLHENRHDLGRPPEVVAQ